MAFVPFKGEFLNRWYPKKASTALGEGAIIDVIDGYIEVCTIARKSHSGINVKPVVSTDSDYASTTRLPILVPVSSSCQMLGDMASGVTALVTEVGNFYDLAGSPVGSALTNATSDDDAFLVDGVIPGGAKVFGVLNALKNMKDGIGTDV